MNDLLGKERPRGVDADECVLAAAERAGLGPRLQEIALETHRGRDDEPLAVRVITLGNTDARHAVWLTTGLHGIERYAGAAFVTHLLENRHDTERLLGKDIRLIIVENLNPWGASWGTRVDQDGVDLARNFRDSFGQQDLPPGYKAVDECLNPLHLKPEEEVWHGFQLALQWCLTDDKEIAKLIAEGQCADPKRFLFAGTKAAWSNEAFRRIIETHAVDYEGIDVHIDSHSGLGPSLAGTGKPLLVTAYVKGSPEQIAAERCFRNVGRVCSHRDRGWISPKSGAIESAFIEGLPVARSYLGVCAELGTVWVGRTMYATLRLQAIRRHPERHSEEYLDRALRAMERCYFPAKPEWRKAVVPALHRTLRAAVTTINEQPHLFAPLRRG